MCRHSFFQHCHIFPVFANIFFRIMQLQFQISHTQVKASIYSNIKLTSDPLIHYQESTSICKTLRHNQVTRKYQTIVFIKSVNWATNNIESIVSPDLADPCPAPWIHRVPTPPLSDREWLYAMIKLIFVKLLASLACQGELKVDYGVASFS